MGLWAVPPGADFAAAFAEGLLRLGWPAERMARTLLLVNTRRAARAIEEALADAAVAAGGPALLPRIGLLSELGADPLAAPDLPPAIDPMRRRLHLIRLVQAYLAQTEDRAAVAAAPEMADALARLFDELQEEGVDPAALDTAAPPEHARHWQQSLGFFDIVRKAWPAIRAEAEGGAFDPKARQRAVIERLIEGWRTAPPDHDIVAAGSTGSVASTAELLAAIARLERGMVVLPGFDRTLPDDIWDRVEADHPMAPFRRVFALLDARPGDVADWGAPRPQPARARLLREALRPAPVTDAWSSAAARLAGEVDEATAPLTLVEAENQRIEAGAIALAIREGLETPGQRIALITPDATLARRVTAELGRFGIVPDDSLGRPLAESPAGVFLRLVGEAAGSAATPVDLAALMLHPLMRAGYERGTHLRNARRYEHRVLREKPQPERLAGTLPAWEKADADQAAWLAGIEAALAPLAAALQAGSLATVVTAHAQTAMALAGGPDAPEGLEAHDDGQAILALLARIGGAADALGEDAVEHWPGLLAALMQGETQRPDPVRPHPRVAIWGTMEARVQGADLMILGGLNEETWPPTVQPDSWLSRPMRAQLGLAPPERAVGLSAHDFLQAALKPRVVLTRSTRIEGTPTVASRWLLRLQNLLGGLGDGEVLKGMKTRGNRLIELTERLHRPKVRTAPAPRPAPAPPVEARPDRLSVTGIETLVRDAYAIYARHVLRLRPLDPLGRPAKAYLERGKALHAIVERFIKETADFPPGDEAEALLIRIGEEVFAEDVPWPEMRRVWRGRLARVAPWFVQREEERRSTPASRHVEKTGEIELDIAGRSFRISARADRIDITSDRVGTVYDYKSGQPPTENNVKAGFSHQLPLQSEMLIQGGFAGLEVKSVEQGAYIGLTGSGEGGVERMVPMEDPGLYLARLIKLLSAYADPRQGYLSRGRPKMMSFDGDYDHLARRAEWEAGTE